MAVPGASKRILVAEEGRKAEMVRCEPRTREGCISDERRKSRPVIPEKCPA